MRGFFKALVPEKARRPVATPVRPVAIPVPRPVAIPAPPRATPQDITLARAVLPDGTRTSIPVAHGMVSAFLAGTKANVTSSLVKWVQYDRKKGELTVVFLPESLARHGVYGNVSEKEAIAFYNAPSKGGFVHDHLWGPRLPNGRYAGLKPWRPL